MSEPESLDTNDKKRSPHRRPPEIDKYVDNFLSTVCDTSRRYILELLSIADDELSEEFPEKRSGEIAKLIGLSAATTSEHLRQLLNAGLLSSRREGNVTYYRLRNHALVQAFRDLLVALDENYNMQ